MAGPWDRSSAQPLRDVARARALADRLRRHARSGPNCVRPAGGVWQDRHVMSAPSGYRPNELLSRLIGFRLFSVQFVMDSVQLRFDGPTDDLPVLNCDVLPSVERAGELLSPGDLGYADGLCAFIPQCVEATAERTGVGLRLEFDGGAIVVHPRREDVIGAEIGLLEGFTDGRWMCWRPGEDSFEDLA